jgi:hypothetical protein
MIAAVVIFGTEMLTVMDNNSSCSIGNYETHSSTHKVKKYLLAVEIVAIIGMGALVRFFMPQQSRRDKQLETATQQIPYFAEWQVWICKYTVMTAGFVAVWMVSYAALATTCVTGGRGIYSDLTNLDSSAQLTDETLAHAQRSGMLGRECRDGAFEVSLMCTNDSVGYVGIVVLVLMLVCALSAFNLTNESAINLGQIRGSHIHLIETTMRVITSAMALAIMKKQFGDYIDYATADVGDLRSMCAVIFTDMQDTTKGSVSVVENSRMDKFVIAMVVFSSVEWIIRVLEVVMTSSKQYVSLPPMLNWSIWFSYILTCVGRAMTGVLFMGFTISNTIWSCPAFAPSKTLNVFYGIFAVTIILAPMVPLYVKTVEGTNDKKMEPMEKKIDVA